MPQTPEERRAKARIRHVRYRTLNRKYALARQREWNAAHRAEQSIYNKAYRLTHKEEIAAKKLARKAEIHATQEAYRAAHREELRAKARIASIRNKNRSISPARLARRRESHRRYAALNPEKRLLKEQKRRAQKLSAPRNDFTLEQWHQIKKAFHHCCAYCGKKQQHLTMDHITPISRGGSHTMHNIVPACQSCNNKKFTGPPIVPVQPLLL